MMTKTERLELGRDITAIFEAGELTTDQMTDTEWDAYCEYQDS